MPEHDPYSRHKLRANRRLWIRRNARTLAILTTGTVVMLALLTVFINKAMPPSTAFTWWLLGAVQVGLVGTYFHLLNAAFLASDGEAIWHLRGAWGEDNTRDVLKKAKRKHLVWGWVDSVGLQHGDIDHLVVTRHGGIVAIDSKWRNKIEDHADMVRAAKKVRLRAEALTRDLLKGDARGSRRARVNPLGVTSVIVLWGAAQHSVPDGAEIDGIAFIPGRKLIPWLTGVDGQPVDEAAAEEIVRHVKAFRARTAEARTTRASSDTRV